MSWTEAKEQMGKMVRWTEQPKTPDENTVYLGTVVQGIYKNKKDNIGQNGSTIYEIETAKDGLVSVWGSTLLDGKFTQIPLGSEVRITYLGEAKPKTPGGRAYRNFKVEYAKPVVSMTEVNTTEAVTDDPGY